MSLRIVFDTNAIVSAVLLSNSVPRHALNKALDNSTILISSPLLFEIADVFSLPKLDRYITENERMRFLVGFLKVTELVEVYESIQICRDPKDDMILELAVSGGANIIVSGDPDLLILNEFRDIAILTPRQFLDRSSTGLYY